MDLDHDACYRAIVQRDARFDGRFFTGVKTTGIYCRPVCPARTPHSRNVVFFPTAAAAQEAGFRPCLRCRPETAPDLGAWRGTSNTVSRALNLIELGALDEDDVDTLAGRLGLGERQLRRLFRQHLGASPVAVAQTRRILLAKQLIHETRLPMAEIAFASGFGSVRRFNETFLALFGRPPSELRRASGPDCPAGPQGEIVLLLRYHPPYDWAAMLEFLRRRAIAGVESVGADCYARAVELNGVHGTVAVQRGAGNALRATVRFPKLSALPTIIARLRRVFDLAADPVAITAHLAKDPALAPLVKARPGLRVAGAWDGFELAIRAVLGQQITVAAAATLAARLVASHGQRLATAEARAHARVSEPRGARLRGPDIARHAAQPRGGALRGRCGGGRRPASVRRELRAGGCGETAAIHSRRGGVDGAVHRLASAARARRFSGGRHRAVARHRRPRTAATFLIRTARPRQCVAALARLRRPASVGIGLSEPGGSAISGIHST